MAGIKWEDVDTATGMVKSGPYAGYAIQDVIEFLESKAVEGKGEKPAGATPPPGETTPPPSPETELEKRANARLQPLQESLAATNARLEQEDEEAFVATVKDYDTEFLQTKKTPRQIIAEQKKTMQPQLRVQKGLHRQLYLLLKQQDPSVANRMLGIDDPPPADPPPAEPPAPSTPPQEPVKPKSAPVSAPPPPRREQPRAPEGPKLKGNAKTEAAARAFGLEHDEYLKRLEGQGTTQDQLDAMAVSAKTRNAAASGGRKTIYDRV